MLLHVFDEESLANHSIDVVVSSLLSDELKYCFSASQQGGKDVKGTYMGKEQNGESIKKQDFQSVCSSPVSML